MAEKDLDTKRIALLYLEKILYKHSDADHILTQQDMLNYLEQEYHIVVERRTVGRCIECLKQSGVDIVSCKKGSYINSTTFTDGELQLLIDGVLSSKYITKRHSKDLISKLSNLGNDYFKSSLNHVLPLDSFSKSDNPNLFYNIELVQESISTNKQISFTFYKFGVDKKLYKHKEHIVTPLQMLLHNQRYYLFAINEKYKDVTFYRMDHIKNMEIMKQPASKIKSIRGYEEGIDYNEFVSRPYLFSDKAVDVEFLADEDIIDQLVDWFGNKIEICKSEEVGKVKCYLNVSAKAMEIWAMQYLNYVEIVNPPTLREKIKSNLNKAIDKYK